VIKIAIFHNLKPGGGLNHLQNIVSILSKKGFYIDIYSHQNYLIKNIHKNYYFPINTTKNSFTQIIQATFELDKKQKQIAKKITKNLYNYIFVFPCNIIQSPHILKYLPKEKTYYFFLEPKREFYEKTSFDYFKIKRIISRLIRYPIKIYDQTNCKSSEHIISNSTFSKNNLKKIYNKKSLVIYPGIKFIKPKKITLNNNHKFLSLGLLTMLKGHHISAKLVPETEIYGEKSHENIKKFLPKNIFIKNNIEERDKNDIYKNHSFFLANQINESFGLTTMEASTRKCYIFGKNEGGTSEIIKNGLNGTLLPTKNIYKTKKIIININQKNKISFYKTCIIDWNHTINQILKVIKYE
jgi:glycosyltransferase involved in cell wall biosynthesis